MTESTSHITTSGGLLTESFIDSMRTPDTSRPYTGPGSFDVPWAETPNTNRELEDEIAAAWDLLRERWDSIRKDVGHLEELDKSATRQRWLLPLLQLLDFEPDFKRPDLTPNGDEGLHFPVSHRGWDGGEEAPAAHLLEFGQDLEERQATGRGPKAKSPHDMMQVFLNVSEEDLWAILSNGRSLRLLRDYYHTFSKGYVEFDLESIFETRNYADFRALYRLAHASRFRPVETDEDEEQLPLEQFHQTARATGVKVGEDLRPQVVGAIEYLGNGFLQGDPELIEELQGDPDKARAFYSEILRVVYRILFLLFAEQRGLVPDADAELKEVYWSDYSLTALREKAEGNVPDRSDHTDLWHRLRATFEMVSEGAEPLGVFGYDGELFDLEKGEYLPERACDNAHLLRALQKLTLIERESVQQRISYLDLGVEELGAVYENLLDFTPRVTEEPETIEDREVSAHEFILDPRGLERKQSGSYYTPDSLVNELIKSALLPVMRDRLADEGLPVVSEDDLGEVTTGLLEHYANLSEEEREAGEEALLSMDVVDPAAGSGHFLVKANDVMGAEVARLRTGDEYPTERAVRQAKRAVLARCIYAVDLNPMAVELCKVSLWINASVQDRPLSFLDHHIKQGNSLIGATPELLEDGIPYEAFPTKSKSRSGDHGETSKAFREKTKTERKESKEGQGVQMGAFEGAVTTEPRLAYEAGDFEQVAQEKPKQAREIYAEYEKDEERQQAKLEADMYTAAFFWPMPEVTDWAPTYGELFRVQRQGPDAIPDEQRVRVEEMAEDFNFFHWHLEFPEVFGENGDGGFDVVLGNPPWEQIQLEEKEFFASKAPLIAGAETAAQREEMIEDLKECGDPLYDEYEQAQHFSNALGDYLKKSGRYDLTAVGRINVYQIFAGLVRQVVSKEGRTGVIVPSGIATDYYTQDYFNAIVDNRELVSLFDFENRDEIFHGVHRSYKFCLLTLTGQGAPEREIDFAFFLTQPEQLSEEDRHFTLTRGELYTINPNTGTCPIFRSKQDAKLTEKLYRAAPVLINEEEDENPWDASFKQGHFNMSSDSDLFHTREDLETEGFELQGNQFVRREETCLPLYEAKMFHQFDHRYGSFRGAESRSNVQLKKPDTVEYSDPTHVPEPWYWVEEEAVEEVSSNPLQWHLAFRNVARVTDVRTGIFAPIPRSGVGNSAPLLSSDMDTNYIPALVGELSTFAFDFVVRQKVGGVNFNFYLVKQLPVHSPAQYTPELLQYIAPRVLELIYTAWDLAAFADDVWSESGDALRSAIESQWQANVSATDGGHRGKMPPEWVEHSDHADEPFSHPPFMWDGERRRFLRAELDALYGHLYGLSHDELGYILETFPIVKEQDIEEFGDYRTKKLILHCFDQIEEAIEQGKAYDPILDLPAIELGDIRPHSDTSIDGTIDESAQASASI
ncbi:Eco57I restriction-modification methylase domain-containing protein [Salinibacter ruber]|uniref:Eco57I restriction-modification methylase domain-containing protein n=1 Tax=Salinibacter ruber TaxID=146919 RepID=UPI002074585D|nr:hypothetical protein [Salinibacter ruber]MCS3612542.1 hypothetical protein [Salinibacter ruber]